MNISPIEKSHYYPRKLRSRELGWRFIPLAATREEGQLAEKALLLSVGRA